MSWEEFRLFWEETKLPTLQPSSAMNYASTMNAFESLCRPKRLADLTTARVTAFAAELRSRDLSEASVARHLRGLKAMARWANRQGLLPAVPTFDMPKARDAARMKGRPITGEELDRMLAACEAIVGPLGVASWRLLLSGLWASGLRLGEALALRWDHKPGGVSVALDGRRSVLIFDGAAQKNGKAEAVALAPEAVELLEPIRQTTGYVFNPIGRDGKPASRKVLAVGRRVSKIGDTAGVVTDAEKGRTATAHDLRRAFGYRWSRRVMPATLKELMRHSRIETTMTYYVGDNAKATAAELWAAMKVERGTNRGPTPIRRPRTSRPQTTKAPAKAGAF